MQNTMSHSMEEFFPGYQPERFTYDGREFVLCPTYLHAQDLLELWGDHIEQGPTDLEPVVKVVAYPPHLLRLRCEDFPEETVKAKPVTVQLGLAWFIAGTVDRLREAAGRRQVN